MQLSRDLLQAHLDHLEAAIDDLLATEGENFIVAFATQVYGLADLANPADLPWLRDQARHMLERRDLVSPPSGGG